MDPLDTFHPYQQKELKLSIIAAIGQHNELGANNDLLWRLSDDLKMFKQLTMGHCIIMGRKTYDSIGKPLPGRINIVVSSGRINQEGLSMAVDLNHAIELARESGDDEAFIIGGGQIYGYAIDLVDTIYLTKVHAIFPDADIFFPEMEPSDWSRISSQSFAKSEKNEYDYDFEVYSRK